MRLAVQLYTLREKLADDLEGTLAALAEAGAREVELAGLYDRGSAGMRAALDAAGLSACSAHVPLERFETELELVLEEANVLTVDTLVVPSVAEPQDAAGADTIVERLVEAAGRVLDAGFGFAYHNHDFEFGAHGLWKRIVASGVDLEPDVGWLRVAGHDPATVLAELHERCPLVHAKDVRRRNPRSDFSSDRRSGQSPLARIAPTADGWEDVVVGEGELDWPAIVAAAEATGATRLIVELDNPSADPVDDVARSLATLRAA